MNIDDYQIDVPKGESLWKAMFDRQLEMARKYGPMESKNGVWWPNPNKPEKLDLPEMQRWIKDFCWRTTEELTEAFVLDLSSLGGWRDLYAQSPTIRHFFEEIADATLFYVELCAVVGVPHQVAENAATSIVPYGEVSAAICFNRAMAFIVRLGYAANALKNKAWKNSQMKTDTREFERRLISSVTDLIHLWRSLDCTDEEIYVFVMKKHEVNSFRQRSRY